MTARPLQDLMRRIRRLERQVEAGTSQPQLAHSSIEDGFVMEYDIDGNPTMQIGQQYDGSHIAAPLIGPTPPTPTGVTFTPAPGGVEAAWDGTFVDGAVAPMDFARLDIVVSTNPAFDAVATPPYASIASARGGGVFVPLLEGQTVYLAAVARSLAGKASAPSPTATAVVGSFPSPPPPPTSDGLPPATASTVTLLGGIGSLFFKWTEVANADPVTYRLYVDDVSPVATTAANLAVSGVGLTAAVVRRLPTGEALDPTGAKTYYAVVVASDEDGVGPTSAQASGILARVTGPDIAAGAVTTELLTTGTALVEALESVKINADWITAGDVNADRFSIGSRLAAIVNGNMEDYEILSNGTSNSYGFAGWFRWGHGGNGGMLSQNIATPISGSRSMRLTLAGSADGQRVVQTRSYPVVGGEQWHLSARVRANRTVDKSALGIAVFVINMRTSDGVADILALENGATVFNLPVAEVDKLVAGETVLIEGYVTIPVGQRMMRMSVNAIEAADGTGWICDIDELTCEPTSNSFQIIDPTGTNVVASIGELGDATFHDFTTTGDVTLRPEATFLEGATLTEVLADSARGVIAAGSRTPAVSGIESEYAIIQLEFQVPEARNYRITTEWAMDNSVANARVTARLRHAFSTTGPILATVGSPSLDDWVITGAPKATQRTEWQFSTSVDLSAGWHSLRFSLLTLTGSAFPGGTTDTVKTARIVVADVGLPSLGANLAYKPASPGTLTAGTDTGSTAPPQTQTYTKTYDANASRWYNGGGTQKSTNNPDNNYFGNVPSTNEGNRKTAIGFDDARIRSDTSGAEITKVEVYLYFESGGNDKTVVIGYHGESTLVADWANIGGKIPDSVRSANWNGGTGRWVNFTSAGADGWRTGAKKGILVGPGPSESSVYAGSVRGVNLSTRPKLRITYKK